jgi:hypothetical protein
MIDDIEERFGNLEKQITLFLKTIEHIQMNLEDIRDEFSLIEYDIIKIKKAVSSDKNENERN